MTSRPDTTLRFSWKEWLGLSVMAVVPAGTIGLPVLKYAWAMENRVYAVETKTHSQESRIEKLLGVVEVHDRKMTENEFRLRAIEAAK